MFPFHSKTHSSDSMYIHTHIPPIHPCAVFTPWFLGSEGVVQAKEKVVVWFEVICQVSHDTSTDYWETLAMNRPVAMWTLDRLQLLVLLLCVIC